MRKEGELNEVEIKILEAAKSIFFKKGFSGAKMVDIASEASINPALLHYYYRSKEQLYDSVLRYAILNFFPNLFDTFFNSKKTFLEKFDLFIDKYIDILYENPHIPLFILHEIQCNPGKLASILVGLGANISQVVDEIKEEIKNENIAEIEPRELIINMLSLCILPFASRPLLERLIYNNESQEYDLFLKNRKTGVKQFIRNAIKPNNI